MSYSSKRDVRERSAGAVWGVMRDVPLELSRDESLKHAFGQVHAIDDLPCLSIIKDVSSDAACSC